MFFKIPQIVTKYLGNFCTKVCDQEFSKIPNLVSLLGEFNFLLGNGLVYITIMGH